MRRLRRLRRCRGRSASRTADRRVRSSADHRAGTARARAGGVRTRAGARALGDNRGDPPVLRTNAADVCAAIMRGFGHATHHFADADVRGPRSQPVDGDRGAALPAQPDHRSSPERARADAARAQHSTPACRGASQQGGRLNGAGRRPPGRDQAPTGGGGRSRSHRQQAPQPRCATRHSARAVTQSARLSTTRMSGRRFPLPFTALPPAHIAIDAGSIARNWSRSSMA